MKHASFCVVTQEGAVVEKVLIVDESTFFRQILKECLHLRSPSLVISEAKNGEETLQIIRTFSPDLIFINIRLPDGNGLELTSLIKEAKRDVRVVIVANYAESEYFDAVFHYKADYYVPKERLMSLLYSNLSEIPHLC